MYHRSREGAIEYCSIYLRTPNLSEGTIIDFLCLNSVQSCVKIIPTSFVLDVFVPAAGAGAIVSLVTRGQIILISGSLKFN